MLPNSGKQGEAQFRRKFSIFFTSDFYVVIKERGRERHCCNGHTWQLPFELRYFMYVIHESPAELRRKPSRFFTTDFYVVTCQRGRERHRCNGHTWQLPREKSKVGPSGNQTLLNTKQPKRVTLSNVQTFIATG